MIFGSLDFQLENPNGWKIFKGQKYAYIYRLNIKIRLINDAMFKWFWTIFSLGSPETGLTSYHSFRVWASSPPNSVKLVRSIIYRHRIGLLNPKQCEIALKYALKLIFLKFLFEIMINRAPPASNSVYGREKLFWYEKLNVSNHVCHCGTVVKELLERADKPGSTPIPATLFLFLCTVLFFC